MTPEFATLEDITIQSVKDFHGVNPNDSGYNTIVTAQLRGVIAYVKFYCGHDFLQTTRTNESPYILPNERHFYLKEYPIASIQSLVETGLTLIEHTDFECDYDNGRVEKIDIPMNVLNPDRFTSAYWSIVRQDIKVSYTGGIALDDNVISVIKEITGVRAGIKKRTWTDNEGIEKVSTLNSISPMWQEILDQYRRRRVMHIQSF